MRNHFSIQFFLVLLSLIFSSNCSQYWDWESKDLIKRNLSMQCSLFNNLWDSDLKAQENWSYEKLTLENDGKKYYEEICNDSGMRFYDLVMGKLYFYEGYSDFKILAKVFKEETDRQMMYCNLSNNPYERTACLFGKTMTFNIMVNEAIFYLYGYVDTGYSYPPSDLESIQLIYKANCELRMVGLPESGVLYGETCKLGAEKFYTIFDNYIVSKDDRKIEEVDLRFLDNIRTNNLANGSQEPLYDLTYKYGYISVYNMIMQNILKKQKEETAKEKEDIFKFRS